MGYVGAARGREMMRTMGNSGAAILSKIVESIGKTAIRRAVSLLFVLGGVVVSVGLASYIWINKNIWINKKLKQIEEQQDTITPKLKQIEEKHDKSQAEVIIKLTNLEQLIIKDTQGYRTDISKNLTKSREVLMKLAENQEKFINGTQDNFADISKRLTDINNVNHKMDFQIGKLNNIPTELLTRLQDQDQDILTHLMELFDKIYIQKKNIAEEENKQKIQKKNIAEEENKQKILTNTTNCGCQTEHGMLLSRFSPQWAAASNTTRSLSLYKPN